MVVMIDEEDIMIDELRAIHEAVKSDDEDHVQTHEPGDENTPEYFSTGPDRLVIDETGDVFRRLDFGFRAARLHIRTTDDIVVAFDNPGMGDSRKLTIRAGESPFEVGGDPPLQGAFLWVQRASSASSDPAVEVLAYR